VSAQLTLSAIFILALLTHTVDDIQVPRLLAMRAHSKIIIASLATHNITLRACAKVIIKLKAVVASRARIAFVDIVIARRAIYALTDLAYACSDIEAPSGPACVTLCQIGVATSTIVCFTRSTCACFRILREPRLAFPAKREVAFAIHATSIVATLARGNPITRRNTKDRNISLKYHAITCGAHVARAWPIGAISTIIQAFLATLPHIGLTNFPLVHLAFRV